MLLLRHVAAASRRAALSLALAAALSAHADAADLPPETQSAYRDAFAAGARGNWAMAEMRAAVRPHPDLDRLLRAYRLATEEPDDREHRTLADYVRFAAAEPVLGCFDGIALRAETAVDSDTPTADLLAWFDGRRPRNLTARVELARALEAAGRRDEALAMAREAWLGFGLDEDGESRLLARFGDRLTRDDHHARLDRLLWRHEYTAAQRMLHLVSPAWRALADARIRLGQNRPGVDAAVRAVPAGLAGDPGLLMDRMRWRREHGMDDGALELLLKAPNPSGWERRWWIERAYHARRLLRTGRPDLAYRVAADHGFSEGFEFAEAEWLAGWIALRRLDRPEQALTHFVQLHDGVGYAISLARAAYWAGRASAALGRADDARFWYGRAAEHTGAFYGQLAAAKLPPDARPHLDAPQPLPADRRAAFERREIVALAALAHRVDASDVVGLALGCLEDAAENGIDQRLVAELAHRFDRPDIAVRVARRSYADGVRLLPDGYPTMTLPSGHPEPALVHALIRQESGFRADAVSRAGARGLMQLMPATARQTARKAGLGYSLDALLDDPAYNVSLGRAHLAELLEAFDGSYVLGLAAYNAGAHRARQWLAENGDPRRPGIDTIDWIELIPFYETRNYVQRVLEGLAIYRWRLDGESVAARPYDASFRTAFATGN